MEETPWAEGAASAQSLRQDVRGALVQEGATGRAGENSNLRVLSCTEK